MHNAVEVPIRGNRVFQVPSRKQSRQLSNAGVLSEALGTWLHESQTSLLPPVAMYSIRQKNVHYFYKKKWSVLRLESNRRLDSDTGRTLAPDQNPNTERNGQHYAGMRQLSTASV